LNFELEFNVPEVKVGLRGKRKFKKKIQERSHYEISRVIAGTNFKETHIIENMAEGVKEMLIKLKVSCK
jgi:CRISPR/Cas system CSM-associated protein Csm3 (group 7 of RAMP superfamily)